MESFVKRLVTIYYAVFALFFVVYGIAWYLINKLVGGAVVELGTPLAISLQSIGIIYVIASIPFALWFFSRQVKRIDKSLNDEEKRKQYGKLFALQIGLIGIGVVLCVVLAVVMNDRSMVYCAACAAVAYVFCKPSKDKVDVDLSLIENVDEDEKDCH